MTSVHIAPPPSNNELLDNQRFLFKSQNIRQFDNQQVILAAVRRNPTWQGWCTEHIQPWQAASRQKLTTTTQGWSICLLKCSLRRSTPECGTLTVGLNVFMKTKSLFHFQRKLHELGRPWQHRTSARFVWYLRSLRPWWHKDTRVLPH